MSVISDIIKEALKSPSAHSTTKGPLPHTESVGTLLGFPGSQTMTNTSLLFISHSVYSTLLEKLKLTKTEG